MNDKQNGSVLEVSIFRIEYLKQTSVMQVNNDKETSWLGIVNEKLCINVRRSPSHWFCTSGAVEQTCIEKKEN